MCILAFSKKGQGKIVSRVITPHAKVGLKTFPGGLLNGVKTVCEMIAAAKLGKTVPPPPVFVGITIEVITRTFDGKLI